MRLLTELAGDIAFALDHIAGGEKLDYLAYYDALTGLANRKLLRERLSQYVETAGRTNAKLALIVSNIERMAAINESLGRQTGDLLLAEFAERLTATVGDAKQIARLGGDNFAIVLPNTKSARRVVSTRPIGVARFGKGGTRHISGSRLGRGHAAQVRGGSANAMQEERRKASLL
jgi:GGDEF domain-containing protein